MSEEYIEFPPSPDSWPEKAKRRAIAAVYEYLHGSAPSEETIDRELEQAAETWGKSRMTCIASEAAWSVAVEAFGGLYQKWVDASNRAAELERMLAERESGQ